MIDAAFLDVLACPKCKGGLKAVPEQSALHCPTCRVRYPVRDGIPILLEDEAQPD